MNTIYIDVLLSVNLFVNYFLLLAVSKINRLPIKQWRMIVSGIILSLSSLVVLLPSLPLIWEIFYRVMVAGVGVFLAFSYGGLWNFIKNTASLFSVSFVFAGIMVACWYLLKPDGMVVHNGIIYYDISPLLLIGFTVFSYCVFLLIRKNFKKTSTFEPYGVIHSHMNNQTSSFVVKIDTGFTVHDIYDHYPVVLVAPGVAEQLRGNHQTYRLLPYRTVKGSGLLSSFVVGPVEFHYAGKIGRFDKLTVAIAEQEFRDEFKGLVGYDFVERLECKHEMDHTIMESATSKTDRFTHRLHKRTGHVAGTFEKRTGKSTDGTAKRGGRISTGRINHP